MSVALRELLLAGAVVDVGALLETVLAATVAGLGVTTTFSLAILGASGSVDARRNGQRLQSAAYAALAVLGVLATLAAIGFGLVVMVR
jgi:hypothetical protein